MKEPEGKEPSLLSGGNPQIPKGDGDGPVQAYIAAMPGWKRVVGRRLDALVVGTVPEVRKAVRWNSPFYGVDGQGWFLGYHCFTKYVKGPFSTARNCVLFLLSSQSTSACVTATSMKEMGSTRNVSRTGSSKHRSCLATNRFDVASLHL